MTQMREWVDKEFAVILVVLQIFKNLKEGLSTLSRWIQRQQKKAKLKLLEMKKTVSKRKTALDVITAYETLHNKMTDELECMANKNIS